MDNGTEPTTQFNVAEFVNTLQHPILDEPRSECGETVLQSLAEHLVEHGLCEDIAYALVPALHEAVRGAA